MIDKSRILPIEHIEAKPHSGKPRIAGRGITVAFLSRFIGDPEWTVERICQDYDLTPGQVYAAWSYYYDNKDEIERSLAEGEERVERNSKPTSDLPGYDEFMARYQVEKES